MPRKLRVEYPGAIYHVMNRGDRREDIFKDDQDRERFFNLPLLFSVKFLPIRGRTFSVPPQACSVKTPLPSLSSLAFFCGQPHPLLSVEIPSHPWLNFLHPTPPQPRSVISLSFCSKRPESFHPS